MSSPRTKTPVRASAPRDDAFQGRARPDDIPPEIPNYSLVKRIGRGSYGEVWLARNATGSYRAVKVVYRATFEADKPYEREFTGIKEFEPSRARIRRRSISSTLGSMRRRAISFT